ncbi:translation initiation factor eIF-2B beta subunit [Ceratobasidium sp. AG-Ba]|nr:translation initiation factor eIF-2B beta subunit [Ceratobasidium sp. AG-Ba]QRW14409.1 translation initiation factor eIF-2B beta subunit [Ceratobasidium sp. AG-Ba]
MSELIRDKTTLRHLESLVAKLRRRSAGTRLIAAQPKEIAVANMVRRVIHQNKHTLNHEFVRREKSTAEGGLEDINRRSMSIKPALIDAIKEIVDQLETVFEGVAKNAKNHIHADEIVLTIGYSRTVESFLKAAAHEKKFTVIVAETAPSYTGHQMATALSEHNISTFLVPDSAIFALMSRVTKLILGAHVVLADGGIVAQAGAAAASAAARAHATSVVVCAGQFKFAPVWSWTVEGAAAADYGDPGLVLSYEEGELVDGVEVVNPKYDYVKPEFLDVIVTNYGDHPPSYVYKLVKEMYEDEDI